MMRAVRSCEEEWRTKPLNGWIRRTTGRACLWIGLECGHYEQRMVTLKKDGTFRSPKKVKCWECTNGQSA
jgi:hypothetical protein